MISCAKTERKPLASVSILAPCLNEAGYIRQFLESALAQEDFGPDGEILILDGLSDDGTRQQVAEAAARDGRIRLVDNPGRSQARGMNIGLREATGEIIVRMDVHTQYAPDYVRQCVRVLHESGAANVGGPALTRWRTPFQHANSLAYHSPFCVGGAAFHDERYEGPVDSVPYGCWRREVLESIGGYDEDFTRNEDDELNLRLHKAGLRVYLSPAIRSWYYPRNSLGTVWRQYVQYGYWKVAVVRKHKLPAKVRHLVPAGFLVFLVLLPLGIGLGGIWRVGGIGVLALYLALLLWASWQASRGAPWGVRLRVPLVISTYHLAYGKGFWGGIVDFLLLRRPLNQASRSAQALTR
jgi:succinoglycan biosynthesis protein ExoA